MKIACDPLALLQRALDLAALGGHELATERWRSLTIAPRHRVVSAATAMYS